ncbi:MAG: OmpA family protein [Rhodospirillaceae bacterium]|nr:OmpA family protein [Rhodospirillales bacterium]
MVRATWRVLAFGALMAAVALPASAQVVIGGSGSPNVEINWAVLDSLGRQPTLADMLKNEVPGNQARAALNPPAATKGVQFRPYKAGADKDLPVKKVAAAKPKSPAVTPISAKSETPVASPAVAQLVQAAQKPKVELPKPVAQPALPPKPVVEPVKAAVEPVKVPVGPQISLPEVPKAVPAAPVQIAKIEPPPAAPVAQPVAVAPPVALAPVAPPAPVAKVETVPQQLAALTPAPAPVAPVSSKGGDTLSVAFGSDSARLSEAVHPELDKLVKRLQKDEGLGLQLLAYAEGDDASASKARRLSLSRALEVRKYLMEQGVRSTRIEVRALGNKLEGAGPADRVDALLVNR